MSASLVGRQVLISISDPWEFVTKNGESRTGTIVAILGKPSGSLEIHLDKNVEAIGVVVDKVFARFRHVGTDERDLMSGAMVPSNFSNRLEGNSLSASPGAVAFIGGLQLLGSPA